MQHDAVIITAAPSSLAGLRLGQMHRQLQQRRDEADQLVSALLAHRAAKAELADLPRACERTDDSCTMRAQQALQQRGEAVTAILGAIGQRPELVQTRNAPDLRVRRHDPT